MPIFAETEFTLYNVVQFCQAVCTLLPTQVQNSDHRWQDFETIKTLITGKLNNLFLILLAKSDL